MYGAIEIINNKAGEFSIEQQTFLYKNICDLIEDFEIYDNLEVL